MLGNPSGEYQPNLSDRKAFQSKEVIQKGFCHHEKVTVATGRIHRLEDLKGHTKQIFFLFIGRERKARGTQVWGSGMNGYHQIIIREILFLQSADHLERLLRRALPPQSPSVGQSSGTQKRSLTKVYQVKHFVQIGQQGQTIHPII